MDLDSLVEGEVGEMPTFSTAVRGLHIGHFLSVRDRPGVKKGTKEKRIRDRGKISEGTRQFYPRKPPDQRSEEEKAARKRYYIENRCQYE